MDKSDADVRLFKALYSRAIANSVSSGSLNDRRRYRAGITLSRIAVSSIWS